MNAGTEQGLAGKGKCRIKLSVKTKMEADTIGRQRHFCSLSLFLCLFI